MKVAQEFETGIISEDGNHTYTAKLNFNGTVNHIEYWNDQQGIKLEDCEGYYFVCEPNALSVIEEAIKELVVLEYECEELINVHGFDWYEQNVGMKDYLKDVFRLNHDLIKLFHADI